MITMSSVDLPHTTTVDETVTVRVDDCPRAVADPVQPTLNLYSCLWCRKKKNHGELFLVYELVPNRTLHYHLHESEQVIPWPTRYSIPVHVIF